MKQLDPIFEKKDKLTFSEIINEFRNLDLKNISTIQVTTNQKIFRARPTGGEKLNQVSQLSYRPWPKSFGRLSTPCSPMFYGSIATNLNDFPLLTNYAELNEVLRLRKKGYNEQEIAVAEFDVIEDFTTAAMIFCKEFLDSNNQFQELYDLVKKSTHDFEILEDFSYLLSSTEEDPNFDYRLTSAFPHFIFNERQDIEAILYPSARLKKEGTNIAIHPMTAKRKLKCNKVWILKLYIQDSFSITDNMSMANKINQDGTFDLVDLTNTPSYLGKTLCLKLLNEQVNKHKNENNC